MIDFDPRKLDRTVHSPVRLAILSALVATEEVDFGFLKRSLSITDGNLSSHIAKLEEKRYVEVRKSFRGKRPCTRISMTPLGRKAFMAYLESMEQLIRRGK